jgi:hypothetical protein
MDDSDSQTLIGPPVLGMPDPALHAALVGEMRARHQRFLDLVKGTSQSSWLDSPAEGPRADPVTRTDSARPARPGRLW